MTKGHGRLIRMVAGALAALAFGIGGAEAIDLRSWDQKINDSSKRFVVLSAFNGEAVLDKETQLVWQRTAIPGSASYPNVAAVCVSVSIGGRMGWRLPTVHELTSLVDVTQDNPALPAGHPFTIPVQGYWTATRSAQDPTFGWFVLMGSGTPFMTPIGEAHGLLCVRSAVGFSAP
jgi:hypothetical protein